MKRVSKDNPLPLYYQLKEILQEMIENNILEAGDPIPTERELSEMHSISRMTVRKAIMDLVNEGLVYREQGRGTFVADTESKLKYQLSKLKGFTQIMKEKGLKTKTKILYFELKEATKKVRNHLKMPNDKNKVIEVNRLRIVEEEPFAIETVWIPYDLCPNMSQEMLENNSFYSILENEYGYNLDYAKQTIEPRILTEYESDLLTVEESALALLFRRTTYLKNGRVIEYTKAVYRSDKYKHEVILNY
ncbi:GntR family transcriptional regulator [Orenia metallireducens]|jgi:GntR family transcriptional regulator|uniref:GntR family transcriptional regulator n=1 Tax=Orenia metallireducens TaxID=1413210 RepID=A0A1C0AA85_9FIRM|nr:GntR family transcriptional regulator [Orenia metallireducens]OCL27207.1 GntR family transcriptional regulator [Orenia metallireducens]